MKLICLRPSSGAGVVLGLGLLTLIPSSIADAQTARLQRGTTPPARIEAAPPAPFAYQVSGDQLGRGRAGQANQAENRVGRSSTPYLYVQGSFGGNWTVQGYGAAVSPTQTATIVIEHTEDIGLDFVGFGPMAKVSGTPSGLQSLNYKMGVAVRNAANALLPGTTAGLVDPSVLNTAFTASSPLYTVSITGGILKLEVSRQLHVEPDHGPGRYENMAQIVLHRY